MLVTTSKLRLLSKFACPILSCEPFNSLLVIAVPGFELDPDFISLFVNFTLETVALQIA